jgi:hypothetical protein
LFEGHAAVAESAVFLPGRHAEPDAIEAPRRVLPDLSRESEVQAREQQEAEERAARRRPARRKRTGRAQVEEPEARALPKQDFAPLGDEASIAVVTGATVIVAEEAAEQAQMPPAAAAPDAAPASSPADPDERRRKKRKADRAACRTAKRYGLPIPPLAPGQRWKRRLPPVCR